MHVKLAALALLSLATGAPAQCGVHQLTTLPAFVSDNGGAAGGAVYFNVTVDPILAANGVRICGLSLNADAAAGAHLGATVWVHDTVTDPFALTSANVTVGNWTLRCGLSGTAAGVDQPSTMAVVSGTGSLDLLPGSYLLAVDACPSMGHRYTNGGPALQVATDGRLTITAGRATNVAFVGTPFGTAASARIANLRIDYDLAAVPVTPTPGGFVGVCATVGAVGTACGGAPSHIHELFTSANAFDLTATDLRIASAGIQPVPQTPIVPPIAPDLQLGDDDSTAFLPLGFALILGGDAYDAISIASNGYLRFDDASPPDDYTESAAELHAEGARVAALWDDLQPLHGGGAGTVHVDFGAGSALVTFQGVALWGTQSLVTLQAELTPGGILLRYDPLTAIPGSALVGYANGVPEAVLPPVDLSAGPVGPIAGAPHLGLASSGGLLLGGTWDLTVSRNPGLAAVLAEIGVAATPGTPLASPPFAAGCTQYVGSNHVSLGVTTAPSATFSIGLPNDAAFLNLPFASQAAAIDGGGVISVSVAQTGRVANL